MPETEMKEMEFLDLLDTDELSAYAYYATDALPPVDVEDDEEIVTFILDKYEKCF